MSEYIYGFQALYNVEKERTARLRAVNAKLFKALMAFNYHFGPLENNEMLHPKARRCMKLARDAFAAMENRIKEPPK